MSWQMSCYKHHHELMGGGYIGFVISYVTSVNYASKISTSKYILDPGRILKTSYVRLTVESRIGAERSNREEQNMVTIFLLYWSSFVYWKWAKSLDKLKSY